MERTVEQFSEKRRKYIGVGGDDVPSLGVLEGDILRILWDAGEPQSSVQVYDAMHLIRKMEGREMQSPSTIAVTLSRMVEKGLLNVDRQSRGGKGYYSPTQERAEVVYRVMNDVSQRLTGQSLGHLLALVSAAEADPDSPDLAEVTQLLNRLKQEGMGLYLNGGAYTPQ